MSSLEGVLSFPSPYGKRLSSKINSRVAYYWEGFESPGPGIKIVVENFDLLLIF